MTKVLIVEDDQAMIAALRLGFEHENFVVLEARDGSAALRDVIEKKPDLIILDVMLPKMSGLDFCKHLRDKGNRTPVIMVTARGQEIDKVVGLKTGADDYVTKPFSFLELLARVEAVLRRSTRSDTKIETYEFGNVKLDFKKLRAVKGKQPLDLSLREFDILKYFIQHRDEVITRDQLLNAVWGYNSFPLSRTVDTHVAKLRQKIENNSGKPRYIITVHRAGYRFVG